MAVVRERIVAQIVDLRVAREVAARRRDALSQRRHEAEGAPEATEMTLAEYDRQITHLRHLLNSDET